MNHCSNCGSQISDRDIYCSFCGAKIKRPKSEKKEKTKKMTANDVFRLVAKITAIVTAGCWAIVAHIYFLIFSLYGYMLLGLVSFIPFIVSLLLTLSVINKTNNKAPMSKFYRICMLIFLSVPTGVMLLLIKDE